MSDSPPPQPAAPANAGPPDTAALLADQRRRWQQGERVLVETYLAQFPDLRNNADGVLDLIYHEIFLREQGGEAAGLEEYLRRFPQWGSELRLQFEVHQAIQPAAPAAEVPGYELLGEIGRGGMGVVHKARDKSQGRLVAVKMLLPEHFLNRAAQKRFLAESRVVLALTHPHIVRLYQVGECAAGPFQVMELIEGLSLDAVLRRGPVAIAWAVATLLPVTEAIEYAHRQGVIHRDLKPSNILIDPRRGPVVMDFGMAKILNKAAGHLTTTRAGTILGTPAFMPPEQSGTDLSATGPFSDVYSLGAILYTLLTGRPPYDEGQALRTILKVRSAEPPPPPRRLRPEVPEPLEQVCLKCLDKQPARRYPTALALAEELRRFQGGASPSAAEPAGAPAAYLVDLVSGKHHPLTLEATVLGRASSCDVVVPAPEVSRRHCQILLTSGQAEVEDLGSLRGIAVNGRRVERCLLRDGDRLELAGCSFQFHGPTASRP
jgi:serine/threonine protein kinase